MGGGFFWWVFFGGFFSFVWGFFGGVFCFCSQWRGQYMECGCFLVCFCNTLFLMCADIAVYAATWQMWLGFPSFWGEYPAEIHLGLMPLIFM